MSTPRPYLPGEVEAAAHRRALLVATVACFCAMVAFLVGALAGANSVQCHGVTSGAYVEAGPVALVYPMDCQPVGEEAGL